MSPALDSFSVPCTSLCLFPCTKVDVSPVLIFEVIAVVLSALSAMITASKKNLDFVGTFALAAITSFGGGTIRDVFLDRRPFFWVSRWEYLLVIFVLCIPFVYSRKVHQWARQLVARGEFVDALGLGFFSVVGVTLALESRMPVVVAVLMGVITSTGGGIMRDLVINEIPVVFRHGSLYDVRRLPARSCSSSSTAAQPGGGGRVSGRGGRGAHAQRLEGHHVAAPALVADRELPRADR